MLTSRTRLPRSTIGEEIRKENVTPNGKPALVKPIKIGIEEQEQNGVTVPSSAPMVLAPIPWNLLMIFLLLSGGKKLWIYEMTNIKAHKRKSIFITSYKKNCMLPPIRLPVSRPILDSTIPIRSLSHFIPNICSCIKSHISSSIRYI